MKTIRKATGFTLIELVIAITIILILAALAIPNYRGHVLRANRSDAMAALLQVAAAQEKFYMQNNTYTADLGATGLNVGTASPNGHYTLTVTNADSNVFIVNAAPPDTSTGQGTDTQCRNFRVDQRGQKTATDSGGDDTTDICWR